MMQQKKFLKFNTTKLLIGILLLVIIFGGVLSRFYVNWLWFGEVGYRSVFWTQFYSKILLGVVSGALFFAIVYANLWAARKYSPPVTHNPYDESFRSKAGRIANQAFGIVILGASIAVGILVGIEGSTHWMDFQMFANAAEFGQKDPIFNIDLGFYIFKLDFLRYVYGWLMFTLIIAFVGTIFVHYTDKAIDFLSRNIKFAPHVKSHLSILLAAILLVQAFGFRISSYNLLYSQDGVTFGAGYTDTHAHLIAFTILSIVSVIAAILVIINIWKKGIKLPALAIVAIIGTYFILNMIYPAIMQQFFVKPDELRKETAYINHNIKLTRNAYNLDRIQIRNFPKLQPLSLEDINNNRTTINSIRLWDYRPLQSTYTQLQSLWQYYSINNVDVDRYMVNGEYRQVMLGARELSPEAAQTGAGTWVNRHFQYTHGYGAVMSPVNTATEKGLPKFFINDMPPKTSVGINITRPEIYYGEQTNEYIIASSNMEEFNYPSEGKPIYNSYSGSGGFPISGYLQRIAASLAFSDLNLILKNPITSESRLMFRRNIMDRVSNVFPFLMYDNDPYLVISNGKLYWMIDAYTVSKNYPYAEPHEISPRTGYNTNYYTSLNYIRNSAKIVIDAYDGTVDFYTSDESDPIIKTYAKIFPNVFKPLAEMPADIYRHIRYPEMLFRMQTQMLYDYHMQDPQVFYNKGDRWETPNEIVDISGEESPMEPYYVIMRLPGQTKEQFLIMRPFTQAQKNNMVAWMGAICDPEDYGKVLLYQFPKDELVYGPAQIEATINQDPVIAPQLSLWNQLGTKVNRGNMIVVPIEKSILYIKPLYLQSDTSKIPELARVVVVYGDKVIMERTLEGALQKVFGGDAGKPQSTSTVSSIPSSVSPIADGQNIKSLINQAVSLFNDAKKSQQSGDWTGYGDKVKQLESTLKRLKELTAE